MIYPWVQLGGNSIGHRVEEPGARAYPASDPSCHSAGYVTSQGHIHLLIDAAGLDHD